MSIHDQPDSNKSREEFLKSGIQSCFTCKNNDIDFNKEPCIFCDRNPIIESKKKNHWISYKNGTKGTVEKDV